MTKINHRTLLHGGVAAAAFAAAPAIGRAQTRPPASRTIRAVFHGDVPTFDAVSPPAWWHTLNGSLPGGRQIRR